MNDEQPNRFGALEILDGELWLGAPHRPDTEWGLRLGSDCLSRWTEAGQIDVPWSVLGEPTVVFVEPRVRGPLANAVRGVGMAVEVALAIASGGTSAASTGGHTPNGFVEINWVLGKAWDRHLARAAANWQPPLTPTQRRAAQLVPRLVGRSEGLRNVIGSPAALASLLDELRAAAEPDAVDAVLRTRTSTRP